MPQHEYVLFRCQCNSNGMFGCVGAYTGVYAATYESPHQAIMRTCISDIFPFGNSQCARSVNWYLNVTHTVYLVFNTIVLYIWMRCLWHTQNHPTNWSFTWNDAFYSVGTTAKRAKYLAAGKRRLFCFI